MIPLLLLFSLNAADVEYARGLALARAQRWADARAVFESGRRAAPGDKRFSIELAGLAFRQRDYRGAEANLRHALRLDPRDTYANDFLATVYLLDGNLEAALKFWNRTGKPRVERSAVVPGVRTDPVLLDRAFAFAPASVLRLHEYRATEARLGLLGAYRAWRIELEPRDDDAFDARFRALARGGWLRMLRGLAYQSVHPEFFDIRGTGAAFVSMLRWDPNQRRALASFSAPLRRDPAWRYRLSADRRQERWNVPALGAFRLDRTEATVGLERVVGDQLSWTVSAGVSHRRFRGADLAGGIELAQRAGIRLNLLRVPERRLSIRATVSSELARLLSPGFGPSFRPQAAIETTWLPRMFETRIGIRAGTTLGAAPFDRLFQAGLDRDGELWLRGHAATTGGRKGSAPLGRNYGLANWEVDKRVYSRAAFDLKLGPFVDAGRLGGRLAPAGWLCDTGFQAKIGVLGRLAVTLLYGRDLRTGRGAFYSLSQ